MECHLLECPCITTLALTTTQLTLLRRLIIILTRTILACFRHIMALLLLDIQACHLNFTLSIITLTILITKPCLQCMHLVHQCMDKHSSPTGKMVVHMKVPILLLHIIIPEVLITTLVFLLVHP